MERKIKAIDATSTAVGKPQENGHLEHFKEPLPNTNQHTSQGILLMMHFPDLKICRFKKISLKRCQSNVESRWRRRYYKYEK